MSRRVVQMPDGSTTEICSVGPFHPARVANPLAIARAEIAEISEHRIEARYLPSVGEAQDDQRANAAAYANLRTVLRARALRGRSAQIADMLGFFYEGPRP